MRIRPAVLLAATAVLVVVLDQATKALVRAALPIQQPVWLIPRVLSLNHVQNAGAAFSIFQGQRFVFIGITLLVLAAVAWAWYRYRPRNLLVVIALGLVVGGAIGNLIDRSVAGTVTDFIDAQVWPVFNVADSSVFIGEAILIVWLLFFADREASRARDGDREAAGSATAPPASAGSDGATTSLESDADAPTNGPGDTDG
jgi:signal peptidase II